MPIVLKGKKNNIELQVPVSSGASSIQPDWNQNDSTALDYVKNRPFWREKIKELAFPGITEPIEVTT